MDLVEEISEMYRIIVNEMKNEKKENILIIIEKYKEEIKMLLSRGRANINAIEKNIECLKKYQFLQDNYLDFIAAQRVK